jgi:hypothetical protein
VETNGWPMRPLLALACLALLTAMLAGCAEDPERYPDGVPTGSASKSSTATGSTTRSGTGSTTATGSGAPGGNGTNHAPLATFSASTLNGTIPVTINFTMEGSDPDGDGLNWTLDFGDGNSTEGAELPKTVAHVYNATGNFTATYTLTDGQEPTVSTLELAITAGGGAGFVAQYTGAQTAPSSPANSAESAAGFCGASCCASFLGGESGVDCVFFELEASFAGHLFTATADEGDPDAEIWASCDPAELFSIEGHLETGPESGTIPEGAGCIVLWAKSPPATPTYTFTVY